MLNQTLGGPSSLLRMSQARIIHNSEGKPRGIGRTLRTVSGRYPNMTTFSTLPTNQPYGEELPIPPCQACKVRSSNPQMHQPKNSVLLQNCCTNLQNEYPRRNTRPPPPGFHCVLGRKGRECAWAWALGWAKWVLLDGARMG